MTEDTVHLPLVYVTCPAGHRTGTMKASGKLARCPRCWHEHGETALMTVPDRAAAPPGNWGTAECRTCRATAPRPGEKLVPHGWMTIMTGTDPAADKYGRTHRITGPYCCAGCAIAGLRPADRGDTGTLRTLMTQKPAGRS